MDRIERFLGKACDGCRLCRYARNNPETLFGRLMRWHGKWCPAWKAQQEIERDRLEDAKRKRKFRKETRKKR